MFFSFSPSPHWEATRTPYTKALKDLDEERRKSFEAHAQYVTEAAEAAETEPEGDQPSLACFTAATCVLLGAYHRR